MFERHFGVRSLKVPREQCRNM